MHLPAIYDFAASSLLSRRVPQRTLWVAPALHFPLRRVPPPPPRRCGGATAAAAGSQVAAPHSDRPHVWVAQHLPPHPALRLRPRLPLLPAVSQLPRLLKHQCQHLRPALALYTAAMTHPLRSLPLWRPPAPPH